EIHSLQIGNAPRCVPRADVRRDEDGAAPVVSRAHEMLAPFERETERRRMIASGGEPFCEAMTELHERRRDVEPLFERRTRTKHEPRVGEQLLARAPLREPDAEPDRCRRRAQE